MPRHLASHVCVIFCCDFLTYRLGVSIYQICVKATHRFQCTINIIMLFLLKDDAGCESSPQGMIRPRVATAFTWLLKIILKALLVKVNYYSSYNFSTLH